MPKHPADGGDYKKLKKKKETKLMGLKPIRFVRTEAKMWFQLKDDLWFDFTLIPFRASANASCSKPHHLKGHWACLECPRGLKAVYGNEWIDRWMDGRRNGRLTDGWIVCISVNLIG